MIGVFREGGAADGKMPRSSVPSNSRASTLANKPGRGDRTLFEPADRPKTPLEGYSHYCAMGRISSRISHKSSPHHPDAPLGPPASSPRRIRGNTYDGVPKPLLVFG